ncbi:DUF4177 domain-containing protein [Finegoldia sp. BIOML-A2]|uniref:DUF4177 domain-containing protein n=1 Tax=unclassified Finegoldia TaxID=2619637 RepID=UPI0012B0FD70|nr:MULTISPECIES: DUF4177 domain-containing protein [unclassified Finegoldia]MSA97302.1 DUF4177 domain-containing protein [Finegoldia sp. BIOML-A5]MSB00628.1 DUF4177 domain-containing protein [Finegoldia sp. BIOML-A2]
MKQKYEYKYVEVRTCGLASDDYKKIIDDYAKEGFRFVTTINKTKIGIGNNPKIDLVFERECKQ